MSNLVSSPAAFDFSQGLIFYHIKAAGCVCFSGARGGGGRTASRGCQLRRAAGRAAGGRRRMLRPLLLALLRDVGDEVGARPQLCSFAGCEGTAPAVKVGAARVLLGFFFFFFFPHLLITEAGTGRDYMKGMISRHSSSPCRLGEGRHI